MNDHRKREREEWHQQQDNLVSLTLALWALASFREKDWLCDEMNLKIRKPSISWISKAYVADDEKKQCYNTAREK